MHRARRCPRRCSIASRAMVDFLAAVLRPDGLMPQVGDADDGRLHILSGYGTLAAAGSATSVRAGGVFFRSDREWSRWRRRGAMGERNGGASIRAVDWLPPATAPDALRHFPHAGLTVCGADGDYLLDHERHRRHRRIRQPQAQRPAGVRVSRRRRAGDRRSRQLRLHLRSRRAESVPKHALAQHGQRGRAGAERVPPGVAVPDVREGRPSISMSSRRGDCARVSRPSQRLHASAANRSCTSGRSGFARSDGSLAIVDVLEGQRHPSAAVAFPFRAGRRDRGGWRPVSRHFARPAAVLRMTRAAGTAADDRAGWYSPSYGVRAALHGARSRGGGTHRRPPRIHVSARALTMIRSSLTPISRGTAAVAEARARSPLAIVAITLQWVNTRVAILRDEPESVASGRAGDVSDLPLDGDGHAGRADRPGRSARGSATTRCSTICRRRSNGCPPDAEHQWVNYYTLDVGYSFIVEVARLAFPTLPDNHLRALALQLVVDAALVVVRVLPVLAVESRARAPRGLSVRVERHLLRPRVVRVLLLLGHSAHVRRARRAAPGVPAAVGNGRHGWRLAASPSAAASGCADRGGRSRCSFAVSPPGSRRCGEDSSIAGRAVHDHRGAAGRAVDARARPA